MKHRLYGQAPSRDSIIPFSGASGRALASRMGLPNHGMLHDLYVIENVIDYWPGTNGKGDRFPIDEARENATAMRSRWTQYDRVLIVGLGTAKAFGLGGKLLPLIWHPIDDGTLLAIVPHPSGVNRYWNDPLNEARANAFLRSAAIMAMNDAGGFA